MQWLEGATTQFQENYGIKPTFNAFGSGVFATQNDVFPKDQCQFLIDAGIIPVVRYVTWPHKGYRPIIKGESDDDFKTFANQAAEFRHPIVLLPWQSANEPRRRIWLWSGFPPDEYKEAWIRMHNIFQREGANKNVIWSTKLINGGWPGWEQLDPIKYIPPKEYVDIIGWLCSVNLEVVQRYNIKADVSFDGQFRSDYQRAKRLYPTKPQMFWELGASRVYDQAPWMNNALKRIRNSYPYIKGVMFDVMANSGYNPSHSAETVKVIKKHFASGYFIGSALKK